MKSDDPNTIASAAESADTSPHAERSLWRAVITTAWQDAFGPRANTDQAEAISFLCDDDGPWARSRGLICDSAGVCPDRLRERAIQRRDELLPESESSLWRHQAAPACCLAEMSS